MLNLKRALSSLATAFTIGALAACGDSTGSDTGRISIKLTDAPGDFHKAVVTIERIYLQGSADSNNTSGRIVLLDTPVTTDLLTLADSTADLVEDAVVPAGTYHQLRFVISGAFIEVENADGSTSIYATPGYAHVPAGRAVTGNLQTPSFSTSGLKVKLPGDQVTIGGEQKILLVDFDVSRSFGRQAGASGQWVMRPVLEATDFVVTGTLSATVARADSVNFPAINGSAVSLGDFKAVLATSSGSREEQALVDSNADGVYEVDFRFLAPGSYTLDLVAPSDSIVFTTSPTRPVAVSVASGGVATRALTVTSARK